MVLGGLLRYYFKVLEETGVAPVAILLVKSG